MSKFLFHHGVSEAKASAKTQFVRWNDLRTASWYSTTQVWSWEGGDAIVVVTGHLPNVRNYIVIRVGENVHVVEGVGLTAAMAAFGFDPKEYTIRAGALEAA